MGLSRSRSRAPAGTRAPLLLLALLAGLAGCHFAPARAWNLEQLHDADGSPRRRANLKSGVGYVLSTTLAPTGFGGEEFRAEQTRESRVKDPLGKCLSNVIALAECPRDERVAGLQAATFAWLAVDCTYVLSRERCAAELGGVAVALRLAEATPPPEGTPATPAEVQDAAVALIGVVREVVASPAFAGDALEKACAGVRALVLDRMSAVRVLRATNALLAQEERGAVFAPLRSLRLELARRCVALALDEGRLDSNGRVRAAVLESSVRALPARRDELLRSALLDPMQGVDAPEQLSLRALELIARYGLPDAPAGQDPAAHEAAWTELLSQLLRAQVDGPHAVAACRAMQKVLGGPPSLRPEVWLTRWRATLATEAGAGAAGGSASP